MVRPQTFLGLLIIYLALQHCLQNPKCYISVLKYQMTWYILARMPLFLQAQSHFMLLIVTTLQVYAMHLDPISVCI